MQRFTWRTMFYLLLFYKAKITFTLNNTTVANGLDEKYTFDHTTTSYSPPDYEENFEEDPCFAKFALLDRCQFQSCQIIPCSHHL